MGFSHDKKKGHCCLLTTNIILLVLSLVIITFVLIALQKQSLPELRLIYAVSFLFALLLAIMAILSFGALCKGCWVYFYFVLCVICCIGFFFLCILLLIVFALLLPHN